MADDIGYGCRLHYSTDDVTYTELIKIVDISEMPGLEVPPVKSTVMLSADTAHEQIPGMLKQAVPKFTAVYDKTRYQTMLGFAADRTVRYWRITESDSVTHKWQGWVSKIGQKRMVEDLKVFDFEVQPSGGKGTLTLPP